MPLYTLGIYICFALPLHGFIFNTLCTSTLCGSHSSQHIIYYLFQKTCLYTHWAFEYDYNLSLDYIVGLRATKYHFAGPFNFEKTGSSPKLHLNPYTWTKVYIP